jgi:hypothetical protein
VKVLNWEWIIIGLIEIGKKPRFLKGVSKELGKKPETEFFQKNSIRGFRFFEKKRKPRILKSSELGKKPSFFKKLDSRFSFFFKKTKTSNSKIFFQSALADFSF